MRSFRQFLKDVNDAQKIAIFCHTNPDADALASSIALKKLIKLNQKDDNKPKIIDIIVDAKIEDISEINQAIVTGIEINKPHYKRYDLAIAVDCANLSRLGNCANLFKKARMTTQIDHHATNDSFAKNNIVLPRASSTCEVLYTLARLKDCKISDDVCKLVYSGIVTDTVNLTQGTITVNTHKIIAEMMTRNINLNQLSEHFFKNNTKSKAFLLKQALDSLTFYCGDRIAFMKLTKQDLSECDATMDDTLGIVNHGIDIKGVEIAVLAIKQEDNSYYVSLRSKQEINVADVAKAFGGGGHDQVAAFTYSGLLGDLKDELIKHCKIELRKLVFTKEQPLFEGDIEDVDPKD